MSMPQENPVALKTPKADGESSTFSLKEKMTGFAQRLAKVDDNGVSDQQFISDLKQLKELRSFLIREAVNIDTDDTTGLSFGPLNLLTYHPLGRSPREDEWARLESLTQRLFRLPTASLRRRFTLGRIPWWMAWLPIIFALIGLAALLLSMISPQINLLGLKSPGANILPFYLVWLMSLGAIGAIAFIGMNALSVQEDATFDLTNSRLMGLRISLGALFGLVLTLPFGFDGFVLFIGTIFVAGNTAPTEGSTNFSVTTQALLLLLPFVLGFSTSLVILILNRLVEAVQGFFGKPAGDRAADPAAPVPPAPVTGATARAVSSA